MALDIEPSANSDRAVRAERLARLEVCIQGGLDIFVDVGNALLAIRDERLYKEAGYRRFDDYCRERWGMARRTAYQYLDAARVVENVRNCAHLLPHNESQARPLSSLEPDQQRQAWMRAVELAPQSEDGSPQITAALVQRAADEVRGISQPVAVTIFSHEITEYYTPPQYIEAAREVMGRIDLDPASCEAAQVWIAATRYYTEAENGLAHEWFGRVWLNPPYSKTAGESNQGLWSQRLVDEYKADRVQQAILLVKAALGYNWFEDLWWSWPVCFARERIAFIKEDGTSDGQSKQGTAFVYLGPDRERFRSIFQRFGRVIMPED